MICGNDPFGYMPYRSSSQLTKFFVELDLEYVHDGSTRSWWVEDVLKKLNEKSNPDENLPNIDLSKVIASIVNPDHYLFNENLDHGKAVESLNQILKSSGLKLKEKSDGQYLVVTTKDEFISTAVKQEDVQISITFSPSVFSIPKNRRKENLISVMMPFNSSFAGTYSAIKRVADHLKIECLRADDIWDNSTFIQDIFDLIFNSSIVIVDFTGRNSNVMYETGIAHTLGKTVIPITQSLFDVPSDLGHHRTLLYLPNDEGYRKLSNDLFKKIKDLI